MNTEDRLLQLYDQWRVFTESEREAIHASDWVKVTAAQAEKQRLQEEIMLAGEAAADPARMRPPTPRLQAVGEHLILLERENAAALADKRRAMELEQHGLDQTSRNLQQVHRAYAQGREPAWQSYS